MSNTTDPNEYFNNKNLLSFSNNYKMAKQIQLLFLTGRIGTNVVDCAYFKGAYQHLFYIRLNVLYMIVLYWKRPFKPTESVSLL